MQINAEESKRSISEAVQTGKIESLVNYVKVRHSLVAGCSSVPSEHARFLTKISIYVGRVTSGCPGLSKTPMCGKCGKHSIVGGR